MPDPDSSTEHAVAQVVERNIAALVEHRARQEDARRPTERIAGRVTGWIGSMGFVVANLAFFGLWVAANLGWLPIEPFDPSFAILAVVGSIEGILLSTFVLITQNRMAALSERRADLDLHISLLAEHEVTRLIHMLTAIADRLGVDARDEELDELARPVAPQDLLDKLDSSDPT